LKPSTPNALPQLDLYATEHIANYRAAGLNWQSNVAKAQRHGVARLIFGHDFPYD
jgi:hypothetical protein